MTALHYWLLPQVSWIKDNDLRRLASAMSIVGTSCAGKWEEEIPTYAIASSKNDIPDDAFTMVFGQDMDVAGDLAYHTLLDGKPYSLIWADELAMSLKEVQIAAGHENVEGIADPQCDRYFSLGTGNGFIAGEISDPVQGDVMSVDLGDGGDPIAQAHFVHMSWFQDGTWDGVTPLDSGGLCTAKRQIRKGGYAQTVTADGKMVQIGEGVAGMSTETPPAMTILDALRMHPAFRKGRLLAGAQRMAMRIKANPNASVWSRLYRS